MIGITFALPSESSDLVRRLRAVERCDNLISGNVNGRDVALVHTGVGARNCNQRLEILLHKTRPRLVISSGFAGAVTEKLRVGDLVLAQNFSDPQLLASAERILRDRQPRLAKLFTSTSIIDSISERYEIARASDSASFVMDTVAIVVVCSAHGVPLISVRAISDSA